MKIKSLIPPRLFDILRPPYHFLLALFAALAYRFPSRRIRVIGVTGTKGKTTVVHLIHEILASSGAKVASLSSLRFRIGEEEELNKLNITMPGRFFLQRFLCRAVQEGCRWAVIEVTSQGIAQYRHRFIGFRAAAMTNLAPEHIEAHGGFEKYLRSKLDLFWRLPEDGAAIINRDDRESRRFRAATGAHILLYGKEGIAVDGKNGKNWTVRDLEISGKGISFDIGDQKFFSPLVGEFNFSNILAALAVGLSQHLALEKMAGAVAGFPGVPGRVEFVRREPFAVVVDYAHTPDSLQSVYRTLRSESQKLICVLGSAGGGRDKWKRREAGRIAAEFCGEIILTDEDPYDENPDRILSEIKSGITDNRLPVTKEILDRREAIRAALRLAQKGDTVVITGKGAEPWIMGPNGKKIPWDDRRVAREELEKL